MEAGGMPPWMGRQRPFAHSVGSYEWFADVTADR